MLPHGATRLGRLDSSAAVTFDVALPPSHQAELNSLIAALYEPSSPQYQQWLAPGEFARRFGPSPTRANAVIGWLRGRGLNDAQLVDGNVEVHTTAKTASSALSVSLSRYRLAGGADTFSAEEAPLVPRSIAADISGIVGLSDTTYQPHLQVFTAPGSIRPAATPHAQSCASSIRQQANGLGGWTTRQVAAKYQVVPLLNAGLNGAGKTIALYELAPHTAPDVSAYLTCFGLHNALTTRKIIGGAPNDPDGSVEANLDIEDAAATAPGAKLISYEGPNSALGSIKVWQAIVNEDKAQIVSTSWGLCETYESAGVRNALHTAFAQAATQGQSIFAATGDSGSEDCLQSSGSEGLAIDSPANEPLVTAVGGTSLRPNVAVTRPNHEPVWNDCVGTTSPDCAEDDGGAAGGGLSHDYAKPSWQPTATGSTCNPGCRELPDLSANAGVGEAFESAGTWNLIGGTSIASPKLAGIAADIGSGCANPLGAFNRRMYALSALGGIYGVGLRDVPAGEGNNDLTRNNNDQYMTANGFDLATGLGTPLANGLACPEVMHLGPGHVAAGTHVKITGIALGARNHSFREQGGEGRHTRHGHDHRGRAGRLGHRAGQRVEPDGQRHAARAVHVSRRLTQVRVVSAKRSVKRRRIG